MNIVIPDPVHLKKPVAGRSAFHNPLMADLVMQASAMPQRPHSVKCFQSLVVDPSALAVITLQNRSNFSLITAIFDFSFSHFSPASSVGN